MEFTYQHTFGMTWSFFAMEYYLGILNRTYQVFVTPTTIAGAFVNSVTSAPPGLVDYWFVPSVYARKALVEKYEEISPYSENFKDQSRFFNFQYQRADIKKAWYVPRRKWGMGTVAHSGKLNIQLASGRKREFILLGLQQGKEILQHLVTGNSNGTDATDFSKVHRLLKMGYEQPLNVELWMMLAELFRIQGEKAQEYYCRAYVRVLKSYQDYGG